MTGMQYKINLPSEYDMEIIKTRVMKNGFKTDGFDGLLFKCYLIQEKEIDNFENVYAPLYLWKNSEGMNKFLFGGFYDNIIQSFGWQNVNIGVPILVDLSNQFNISKYAVEVTNDIPQDATLTNFQNSIPSAPVQDENYTGRVCIYNPDKWKYSIFYFYKERPVEKNNIFQILYISEG